MPLTLPVSTVAECLRTDCYILGDKKKSFLRLDGAYGTAIDEIRSRKDFEGSGRG